MNPISSDILSLINPPQPEKESSELSQDDFINLMITQLRNQDPFEPLQSGEFIGQLAQFGTVSGISELKDSVSDLASSLLSNQTLEAANLIGKKALVPSDSFRLEQGESVKGAISVNTPSNNVSVRVFDAAGNLVQTLPLGVANTGIQDFAWDGVDAGGNPVPDGLYFFTSVGNQGETSVAFDTFSYKEIQSISIGQGNSNNGTGSVRLNVSDGSELKISDLLKIE